jgi:glycosyltransferase involved in cell wall biosynthesis
VPQASRIDLTAKAIRDCGISPTRSNHADMKVSGFTFVRDAIRLDYPIVESIRSILPIVDEFVVNVGASNDGTIDLVRRITSPKLKIVESAWNPNLSSGGYVLAQQTNIALFNCTGDWAIYLQSDEAIHERDHAQLLALMARYRTDDRVEGLVLQRVSFYGDYETILNMHPLRCELVCRVVKPHRFVLSRGDALGFTVHPKYKEMGHRIRVVDSGLDLFHYLDVRSPATSKVFIEQKSKFWIDGSERNPHQLEIHDHYYNQFPRQFVMEYRGSHPASMQPRIQAHQTRLDLKSPRWRTKLTAVERKLYLRTKLIDLFGWRIGPGRSSRKIVGSHRRDEGAFTRSAAEEIK